MMRCVQCDTELVAPVRSEYWSDKHACHIWLCPKCCVCFSSLVSIAPVHPSKKGRLSAAQSGTSAPPITAVQS
jgi:hypothetical protein